MGSLLLHNCKHLDRSRLRRVCSFEKSRERSICCNVEVLFSRAWWGVHIFHDQWCLYLCTGIRSCSMENLKTRRFLWKTWKQEDFLRNIWKQEYFYEKPENKKIFQMLTNGSSWAVMVASQILAVMFKIITLFPKKSSYRFRTKLFLDRVLENVLLNREKLL